MNVVTSAKGNHLDNCSREPCSGDQVTADCGVIEMHIQDLSHFFDAMDPSPSFGKDLSPIAEQYILDSVKELSMRVPSALVIYLDQSPKLPDQGRLVGDAIRVHFSRKSQLLRRKLRELIRRGWISLGIGLVFLAVVFSITQLIVWLLGDTGLAQLMREGLLIVGWVAMWRPLEIFLYDWWPIVGERRVHDRLSRIKVRIVNSGSKPSQVADVRTDGTLPIQ
jgi:hypothetical protein